MLAEHEGSTPPISRSKFFCKMCEHKTDAHLPAFILIKMVLAFLLFNNRSDDYVRSGTRMFQTYFRVELPKTICEQKQLSIKQPSYWISNPLVKYRSTIELSKKSVSDSLEERSFLLRLCIVGLAQFCWNHI
jgi:hypothetical protein